MKNMLKCQISVKEHVLGFCSQLKKNVLNVDFHMAQYGKIVKELRKEVSVILLIEQKTTIDT